MVVTVIGRSDNRDVENIEFESEAGLRASILTYGATLRDLQVPVGSGRRRVVLGYQGLDGYLIGKGHLGATVGRFANRIGGACFTLDGREYRLPANEKGRACLHGGPGGFSSRLWSIADLGPTHVTLSLDSPNGDQGFPGRVAVFCTYRLQAPATLSIHFSATTDAPTPFSLAHHSYFTLDQANDIRNHRLKLAAGFYTPVDVDLIPTGEVRRVEGTRFDFRTERLIGEPRSPSRLDTNMVLTGAACLSSVWAATLIAPNGDLALSVDTTEPGLQVYDAGGLTQVAPGIDGQDHRPYGGLCLEAQRFPDTPNQSHFPPAILRPGARYDQWTTYRFHAPPA